MKLKILFFAVYLMAIVNMGYACTCGGENTPRVRFDRAKIVFSGTVIEKNEKVVKLRVEKAYKGTLEKEVVLKRRDQETTCDVFFRMEEKYLVFADEVKVDGKVMLETSVCAGTRRFVDSKEDVRFLETPDPVPNLGELVPPKENKAQPKTKRRIRKS